MRKFLCMKENPTNPNRRVLVPLRRTPCFLMAISAKDKLSQIHTIPGLDRSLDIANSIIFRHSSGTSVSLKTQPKRKFEEIQMPHGSVFLNQGLFLMAASAYLLPCTGLSLPHLVLIYSPPEKNTGLPLKLQEDYWWRCSSHIPFWRSFWVVQNTQIKGITYIFRPCKNAEIAKIVNLTDRDYNLAQFPSNRLSFECCNSLTHSFIHETCSNCQMPSVYRRAINKAQSSFCGSSQWAGEAGWLTST